MNDQFQQPNQAPQNGGPKPPYQPQNQPSAQTPNQAPQYRPYNAQPGQQPGQMYQQPGQQYQQPGQQYQQPGQMYQQPGQMYRQPGQQYPMYNQGAKPPQGFSIAALVCGILGIIGGFIPVVCWFTLILAILGIVFGVKGRKIAASAGVSSGLGTAGLVLGIIGTSISLVGAICFLACAGAGLGALDAFDL